MAASDCRFVPLAAKHREAVIAIYNYYVANTLADYPNAPVPLSFFDGPLNYALVAEAAQGEVVGFAMLRPYAFVRTLKRPGDLTYFVRPGHTRQGIGTSMLDLLIAEAKKLGIDNLTANVSSLNPASIAFHRRNGFRQCGRFRRVGTKFGQDFDIVFFQRHLADNNEPAPALPGQ